MTPAAPRVPQTARLAPDPADEAGGEAAAGASAWRTIVAVALLAAVTVAWAAGQSRAGSPAGAAVVLVAAIGCAALSVAQLAVAGLSPAEAATASLARRTWLYLLSIIRALPWAELVVVLTLVLEVVHRAQPWHTGVLGIALIGYLLAIHLCETRARPRAVRPQVPLIAAGIGLAALAVGAAELPGLPASGLSAAIRLLGTIGACVVGALALPVWFRRRRSGG